MSSDTGINHEAENTASETSTVAEIYHTSDSPAIRNVMQVYKDHESEKSNDIESADDSNHTYKQRSRLIISDSDSENESSNLFRSKEGDNETNNADLPKDKKNKRSAIFDSDSEEEMEPVSSHNKSFSEGIDSLRSNEQPVFITNSEGKLIPENTHIDGKKLQARLSLLCDSESSEDEVIESREVVQQNEENYSLTKSVNSPKPKKLKPNKSDIIKPKKMTGKKAAELRKEIKSESQRMLREKNVSLPYHIPKSYTIKEFLSRRPKFSSAVPVNIKAPPSVAMKMSAEQLSLVSKKLEEREKEVKEFYKSESESEDGQDDKDYMPPNEAKLDRKENIETHCENMDNASVLVSDKNKNLDDNSLLAHSTPIVLDIVENRTIEKDTHSSENTRGDVGSTEYGIMDAHSSENTVDKVDSTEYDGIVGADSNTEVVTVKEHTSIQTENVDHDANLNKDESDTQIGCHNTSVDTMEKNSTSSLELNAIEEKEHCTEDYEFNLDGLEENSENICETEDKNKKNAFQYTELDKEIENFGFEKTHNSSELPVEPKPASKLDLIKERIANIQPKLTGGPDDVIDLESGVTKPNEVTKLMERFVEHNFKKPVHKNKVQLSITSVESGEIHKETVAMNLDDETDSVVQEEKPGAKLQKLRDELQNQMAQKRAEMWQKKITEQSDVEKDVYDGEKDNCGLDNDDILDDEEEIEMSESSEEDDDDEEEEAGEEYGVQKEKKKSIFINEEADETDEEEDAVIEEHSDEEEANLADDENEITEDVDEGNEITNLSNDEVNDDEIKDTNDYKVQPTSKTYRKILKGFTEDSDEEECSSKSDDINNFRKSNNSFTPEDDLITPYQLQNSQKLNIQTPPKKSSFEFLTPISYMTGLQNLTNSASKNLKDSPVTSAFQDVNELSPLKEDNWQQKLQKKLFMSTEITDSQAEANCLGNFPETQEIRESVSGNNEESAYLNNEEFPCTSSVNENDLVNMCCGKFPSPSELIDRRLSDQTPTSQELLDICSGKFTGITQNESEEKPENISKSTTYLLNTNKEVKSLDEDQDLIISQLIDEEEMEKFKKQFESPLISNTQRRIVEEFEEAVAGGGVIDSDEEADVVEVKRKNKKRLMFSDDEVSDDEKSEEEVIDLHDNVEDDEDSDVPVDNVGYDSEENEIEYVNEDASVNLKPSDFFENEAELSESEWGSADEDEKDLDTLEFEQGDAEKFDEKKIRTDLEKIHMRRLLDEDSRQVKLLQEMLLEDGELHGTGRERQFKWKNIDSVLETDEKRTDEDDIYLEEEESEEQWRKKRYEREMFLQDKLKKSQDLDDDDLLSESQLLKIGQKVLQRSLSNSQNNTPTEKSGAEPGSPIGKQSFTLLNKRGSFLSRSDKVLQRLAEYSKTTSLTLGTATAKNSRNFLFQTVTVEKTSVLSKDKKRKAEDGTPHAIKKLRLSNNLSPAVKKKPSAKAKLFNNW